MPRVRVTAAQARSPKLLPCPFCGGPAEYEERPDGFQFKDSVSGWHSVHCKRCCAVHPHTGYRRKRSEAVRIWNRRNCGGD